MTKPSLVLFCLLTLVIQKITYGQSYQYKPVETPVYNPSPLLEKYNSTPQTSTPTPTYTVPKTYTPTSADPHSITISNKAYDAKTVDLYIKNASTLKWEYYKPLRIPGGMTTSFPIGQYEYYYNYAYVVQGSMITTITPFRDTPLIVF